MKKILIKHGKWLGYLLYTVVLVTALLYCRFPSDTIRTYLESRVAAEAPGWALSVEGVSPGIPPGLDMTNVSVWSRETPQKHALQAKRIAVSPAFGAFVSGAAEYRFNAHAYNGDITGRIRFEQNDMTGPFSASVQLKGLHVGLHPYLPPLAGRDVSGILGGDISFSGTQRRLLDGAGKGIITISDGSVKLLQPVMGLEAVDFDRLSLKMAL